MIYLAAAQAAFAIMVGVYLWWRVPRGEAAGVLLCTVAAASAVTILSMGIPRPFTPGTGAKIIAHVLDEPNAIYIWVAGVPPVAYELPWRKSHAKQINKAAREAKRTKGAIAIERGVSYGSFRFRVEAPKPNPPKTQ